MVYLARRYPFHLQLFVVGFVYKSEAIRFFVFQTAASGCRITVVRVHGVDVAGFTPHPDSAVWGSKNFISSLCRGVAQLASAPRSGRGGRGFESRRPDRVR